MAGEAFDSALAEFLDTHAGDAGSVDWSVKADLGSSWEVALWLDGEYAGLWVIDVSGSRRLEAGEVEQQEPLVGLAYLERLIARRATLEGLIRVAIREAVDAGEPVTKVAASAGLTRQRVYQIVGGRS